MIYIKKKLKKKYTWLITGVAGFIGSNLLCELLHYNQNVIGIDNFSNSSIKNLNHIKSKFSKKTWKNFKFYKEDINNSVFFKKIILKVDFVLHQAARGSVAKSTIDPIKTNRSNIDGFLNLLFLSKNSSNIKSFVYASSGSVYGDSKILPKVEKNTGKILSNYGLTKKVNEEYAELFYKLYNFKSIGLRYFNVFGKYQNPHGDYAAVIPKWINSVVKKKTIYINGDGKTTRDFTPVECVVQANILAALRNLPKKNYVFNVGTGKRISLNNLILNIYQILKVPKGRHKIINRGFRKGDIRHSLANINNIKKYLGYKSTETFTGSLKTTIKWFTNIS